MQRSRSWARLPAATTMETNGDASAVNSGISSVLQIGKLTSRFAKRSHSQAINTSPALRIKEVTIRPSLCGLGGLEDCLPIKQLVWTHSCPQDPQRPQLCHF